MERKELEQLTTRIIRQTRPYLSALTAVGLFFSTTGSNGGDMSLNAKNLFGESGPNASKGTCAPFERPNWYVDEQIAFRCITLNGEEYRLRIHNPQLGGVRIETELPRRFDEEPKIVESWVPHNTLTIVQSPYQECVINVNTIKEAPSAKQFCSN